MEERNQIGGDSVPGSHERERKLQEDQDAQAYEDGARAARDAFGKVGELLVKEKQKRRSGPSA